MSTSPASPAETIIVSDAPVLLNVNMANVTKLTTSNYIMWSRQVHALLDGYDLAGYLDGSIIVPSPTAMVEGMVTTNTAYTLWKRQDKLLYSALLGAISNTIQPLLSKATMAAEIWEILSSTYAKPSRGHLQQIRRQIKNWTKGSKSIDEYIQGLTTRFDQLALLGKTLDLEDQLEAILAGLPEEYKTVADQLEGQDTSPSITDVHEKLINYEAKLQLSAADVTTTPPVTANTVAYRGPNHNNNKGYNQKSNYRGHQS